MTVLDLIKELQEKLSAEMAKFELPAQNAPPQKVKVFSLKLPTDDVLSSSLYPLVFIEFVGSTDNAPGEISEAQILFTIGNYATNISSNGAIDNLNILQALRTFLLTNKLIGAASLQYPLESFSVESTSEDFLFSQILATYKIFSVQKNYLEV